MKFSHFFIDRPIFATVAAVILMIIGGLNYFILPIEQYPEVAPPTVQVTAVYPGANAETLADTVATPLEQEISGVEGMLYLSSQSTSDGQVSITVTFEIGTDLDTAQVLVQNRVAIAEPRLPEPVRRLGVTTQKNSPDLMLVVNLYSPDGTYGQNYIANYAVLQVVENLKKISGVGNILVFGGAEYAMRIWLNPDLIQSYGMTAGDVLAALRAQNIQVASGTLNQPPQDQAQGAFEYNVQTQGRLKDPSEFGEIIVKSEDDRIVKLRDIARIELGVESYTTRGYLGKDPAIALPIFQRPGSNALKTADEIRAKMDQAAQSFPPGLEYEIVYDPTQFISKSIHAVFRTIIEAMILVIIVIMVFLQSWRAAVIPIAAIPISLIGTFAVMNGIGFSLNNLTLFGLVLSIGIVVDDAIVVVENVDRSMRKGMNARDAARKAMDEIGSALIATSLVLVAVFLPTAMMDGLSGKFYQQFGVVVAVATVISTFVSLTLSPAMAALFMRVNTNDGCTEFEDWKKQPVKFFCCKFNAGMDWLSDKYGSFSAGLVRKGLLILMIYAGLMALTGFQFKNVPGGFIPPQDQGYFIVAIQLPPGASLDRTDAVVKQAIDKLLSIEGVTNAVSFAGFSGATFTSSSNAAAIFPVLEDFEERRKIGAEYGDLLNRMRQEMATIKEAFIVVIPPPPVAGIGTGGGFKMMLQDRGGIGIRNLEGLAWAIAGAANQQEKVTSVYTLFDTATPQIYLDINREQVERLGVDVDEVFDALQIFFGSIFVNDFNYLGRTFQVIAQADEEYRLTAEDISRVHVRNNSGDMVPLGSVVTIRDDTGPSRMPRYNLFPAIDISGDRVVGYSTGEALETMERIADQILPDGVGFEWTEIAYQEKNTGNTAMIAFTLAVIFVLLLLAAQYESWILPLAVVLIVPMCLLSAITGVWLSGGDNNILSQIGFVILIGLACKNAILIVEFARDLENQGMDRFAAAVEAAKLRLRPILMTSFSFILGVLPLVLATGAGAEMRQALGITVFSGMIGVTFFGLLFTPVFYVLCRKLAFIGKNKETQEQST